MVKPKDLPLYVEEIEETKQIKKRPEALLNASKEARLAIQSTYNDIQNGIVNKVQDSIFGLIDTGKATRMQLIETRKDSRGMDPKHRDPRKNQEFLDTWASALTDGIMICGSTLLGYILGRRAKRFRSLKRLLYPSVLGVGAAYTVYPLETKNLLTKISERAYQMGRISYILAQGAEVKDAGNEQNSLIANPDNNNT